MLFITPDVVSPSFPSFASLAFGEISVEPPSGNSSVLSRLKVKAGVIDCK